MKFGIIGRQDSGYFRYQGWPTVAKAEDGTLYAVSSGHRVDHVCPFGKNLMYVSHDEGETWSAPQIVNDTHLGSPVFMERFGAPAHFCSIPPAR